MIMILLASNQKARIKINSFVGCFYVRSVPKRQYWQKPCSELVSPRFSAGGRVNVDRKLGLCPLTLFPILTNQVVPVLERHFKANFFRGGYIDIILIYQLPRAKRQTGKTGQTGRTEKIELTFKHDFSGKLCRAAFAILGTFYKGASLSYDQAVR